MGDKPLYLQGAGRGRGRGSQTNMAFGNQGNHSGRGRGSQTLGKQGNQAWRGGGSQALGNQGNQGWRGGGSQALGNQGNQGWRGGGSQALGNQGNHGGKGRGERRSNNSNFGNMSGSLKTAEQRFQTVSAQHQEAVKKHLENNQQIDFDEDSGEEGEEDEEDSINDAGILNSLLKSFSGQAGDGQEVETLGKTQEFLMNAFKSESNICLICIETIKRSDAIWSCEGCYCPFHIPCIQKWVKEGVYQQTALSEEHFPKRDLPWFCPKCRFEYKQNQCPSKYLCYCGKEVDPTFDPWLVPHSCGQTCGKLLKPECGHACLLLCHPGPCPPCPKTVKVACFCGKQPPTLKRCGIREWSCGQRCARLLPCGNHKCRELCHKGECPACPEVSLRPCQCGQNKASRPCASPVWQCDKVCGKLLSCGIHTCEEVCHTAGVSHLCPRAQERSCPCGKSKASLPCTEDIPTCGDTCDKLLECGVHHCSTRCHNGPCGTCLQMITKRCRCGAKKKEVPCYKEYLCETKCTKLKDCGKHACKRKCCDGNCPACEQQCGKNLGCRNHKCASRCHTGPCYPCPLTADVKCNCGSTVITVPCGREKVTKPPRCNKPCSIPPDCHHPSREKHRCHFGRCPPCRQVCRKTSTCGHICPMPCHSAVLMRFQEKVQRSGPWEPIPEVKFETVNQPCPPCRVPMPVTCEGQHETIQVPCSELHPYSCGHPCGRLLECSNHTCQLLCHLVKGAADDKLAGSNCAKCEEGCSKPRPEGCTHECLLPCHPGDCPQCQQMFRMRCHCKLMLLHVECDKWCHADGDTKKKLQACQNRCPKTLSCGHQCPSLCHSGQCPSADQCTEKAKVTCSCRRKKKNFPCQEVQTGSIKLECDEKCREDKVKQSKLKEIEEAARRAEEEKKQQEALEEYERKMKGRKRKPRKQKEVEEIIPVWKQYGKYAVFVIVIAVLSAFSYHIISQ